MAAATARISSGALRGAERDGVCAFLGVPYAAAPVAELRFAAPAAHPGWQGTRDAMLPGPTARQFSREFPVVDLKPLVGHGWQKGDEFLTANIWTPDPAARGLPVAVYIHGGAFVGGSNNAAVYDGAAFARSGVVLASINYRLGIEGFLPIPGAPSNLGLRDMLAALHWVQKEISAFGGDPARVTVFGESSGAMAIGALLGSPLSKGLFRRAILQSGHASLVRSPEIAARVVARAARLLGITADARGFHSTTAEQCVEALKHISNPKTRIDLRDSSGRDPLFGISKPSPVFGDDVLPEHPLAAIAKGMSADVEVIAGANSDEMNLYFVPTGIRKKLRWPVAVLALKRSLPRPLAVLREYGLWRKGINTGAAFSSALTDLVFRAPVRQLAAAHQGKSYVYNFDWHSPACNGELGACHGLELPFVFNNLACCSGADGLCGENPPPDMALEIHQLWVDIISGKEFPWPRFDAASRTLFDLESGDLEPEQPLPAEKYLPPTPCWWSHFPAPAGRARGCDL